MLLPDVNVLIYAHVEDSIPDHADYATWITRLATVKESFAFLSSLVERPTARVVGPGPDHLDIFEKLCRESGATGKLVADA